MFEPDEHTCLHHYAWTRDRLVLVTLADVASRVEIVTPGTWQREPVPGIPAATNTVIVAADDTGDEIFLDSSGFDTPVAAAARHGRRRADRDQVRAGVLRRRTTSTVAQHFATSEDGTAIPYFVVGHRDAHAGPARRCSAATADSRIVRHPGTAACSAGCGWPAAAPTCWPTSAAAASTGPRWHTQAMREGRHKVAEDFAAVAARSGATAASPPSTQLGAQGGSNGGLLMGIMLTKYPELFGALVCSVPLLDMKRYHLLLAGRVVGGRVRRPGQSGRLGVHLQILAVPEHFGRCALPAAADHHVHPRRPGAPRATPAR